MNKNELRIKEKLQELEKFKDHVYSLIGKKDNFKIQDLEKYILKEYGVKSFNSLQELYKFYGYPEIADDVKEHVDVLAFHIVENRYKVAEIKGKDCPVTIFYQYDDNNDVVNMFIDTWGLPNSEYIGIFIKNGENSIKNSITVSCGGPSKSQIKFLQSLKD